MVTRILWGVTAVLLLAGILAVPTVAEDGTPNDSRLGATVGAGATTTAVPSAADGGDGGAGGDAGDSVAVGGSTTAPNAATGGVRAAQPATTAPPGRTAAGSAPSTAPATTAAPPPDLGGASDPGPASPARPGTYRYKGDRTTNGETTSLMTTRTYEDKSRTPTETQQVLRIRGDRFDSDSDIAWRDDGVYNLKSVFVIGGTRSECDWTPDIQEAGLPMSKGRSWETTGRCVASGFNATVSRKVTGKVVDLRRVRIAGQVLDVWVIEGTEHIEFAGNVGDSSSTSLFSPKHGLVVHSSGKVSGSGGGQSGSGSYTLEIQNLDPE